MRFQVDKAAGRGVRAFYNMAPPRMDPFLVEHFRAVDLGFED